MIIRPAARTDLPGITDIYNHYVETSHATFDTETFTPAARRQWFDQFDGLRHQCWVATDHGQSGSAITIVGYATSQQLKPKAAYGTSVEVSVYIAAGATGRGTGAALYRALIPNLEDQDIHRAYAIIALPNEASVALHQQFGFRQVACLSEVGRKFGRYWDVIWMEREI